jgi:type 1 glutamine amidotransferase
MKNIFSPKAICLFVCIIIVITACSKPSPKPRILVFSKTAGYYHQSIPDGIQAIYQLGRKNNFDVDTTTDSTHFTYSNLKKYAAIVFLSTTGNVLSRDGENAFEQYIKSGGGYVGIHSSTDTEYDWTWYGKLAGAYFLNHPEQQEAILKKTSVKHLATLHLPNEWKRKDEWYNFKNFNNSVTVLMTIDEKSYKGGKNGDFHPVSWFHEFDGGRAFYTALGHTKESYYEENFLNHLLGGILYAIGSPKTQL